MRWVIEIANVVGIGTLSLVRFLKLWPGKMDDKISVAWRIGNTPEVKKLLESNNKKTFAKYQDYVSYPSIYTKEDVDLRISNTTVRGILNRIVSAQISVLMMVNAGNKESLPVSDDSCRAKNNGGDTNGSPIM